MTHSVEDFEEKRVEDFEMNKVKMAELLREFTTKGNDLSLQRHMDIKGKLSELAYLI